MEKNKTLNSIKNPNFLKEDIFLDYLNYNNNPLTNEEFIKPKFETFDKFFNNEENSPKSNISSNKSFPCSRLGMCDQSSFNSLNSYNEKIKINGGKGKNLLEENYKNNNNEINLFQNLDENNCMKKQLFNIMQNQNFTIEDLRKKKLIMNRESAKKSRLKKKKYIENLEKEFLILKEELIRIKSNQNINVNNHNKISDDISSNKIIENIIKNQNCNNLNYNNKEKEMLDLKKDELNIITNNLEKNNNIVNNFVKRQKNVLSYLLVKQIDIMTPIKIKAFQNKFLKLEIFDPDDSIEVIKNKINSNLNTIIELYDIDIVDNSKSDSICTNKKKSMAYNLYDFYNSLKNYVNQYDYIYNKIENV